MTKAETREREMLLTGNIHHPHQTNAKGDESGPGSPLEARDATTTF